MNEWMNDSCDVNRCVLWRRQKTKWNRIIQNQENLHSKDVVDDDKIDSLKLIISVGDDDDSIILVSSLSFEHDIVVILVWMENIVCISWIRLCCSFESIVNNGCCSGDGFDICIVKSSIIECKIWI